MQFAGRIILYNMSVYIQDFALSEQEQKVLIALTEPHLDIARELARRRRPPLYEPRDLSEEVLGFPAQRSKRQTDLPPPTFESRVVSLALDFEDTCNPVLRASARSIIEDTEE